MVSAVAIALLALGQDAERLQTEEDFYRIVPVAAPAELVLEVSGFAILEDGRPMLCTRRGEVFVVDDAYSESTPARYTLYADGLQEPLGLLPLDGWIYVLQRAELSRMRDLDGDDRVDEIETVCDAWAISGNYHEYNYGPVLGPDGRFWITTNRPFGDEPFGRADWRGFALSLGPDGSMRPIACGLRSPCGLGVSPAGEVFYSDNQGEWNGTNKLCHIEPGDFFGHPFGLDSCKRAEWPYGDPGLPISGKSYVQAKSDLPSLKLPAVWFPYDEMGKSAAGFVWDRSGGAFGPFDGQMLIGDQHHASLMRVDLERVNGVYQGACFPFKRGFASGIVRVEWGADGSLLVGETNRGWGSLGNGTFGFERLVWTGETPFEVRTMRARSDGFELEFTLPVDGTRAADASRYGLESYTYLLHEPYGSPEVDLAELAIRSVEVSADGLSVRLVCEGLRAGYVHELRLRDLRDRAGAPLLHDVAYYTMNEIPLP